MPIGTVPYLECGSNRTADRRRDKGMSLEFRPFLRAVGAARITNLEVSYLAVTSAEMGIPREDQDD